MHNEHDSLAFDLLYAEYAEPTYRFALRLCGNREEAEDLASEAFLQALRHRSQLRNGSSVRPWLCSIVLNEWRMRCRRHKRTLGLEEAELIASSFRFPDLDLAQHLCSLNPKLREALLLVKGEGLTHREAARVVGIPVGTMYFRVHAAVGYLRERMAPPSPTALKPEEFQPHEL